ncbi:MAG: CD3324 family protein [Ruminococcus sp.]|nr:CD3324 family protein [Ruminococcus sp.]
MGYRRAEEILPKEIIEMIQEYVDGENIYIPRKKEQRKSWGENTRIKEELIHRNESIFEEYRNGLSIVELSEKYFLSTKSIQRILRQMKQKRDGAGL